MKQKLLLLLSVSLLSANADTVSFPYDSAGNRVKREIIVEKKSAPSHAGTEYFSEIISEKEIKIYPNPTEGVLKRQGDNTLIGKINGLDRSVKVYLDNNTVKSINLYPGISNRGNLKNPIINFGEVKW